MIDNKLKYYMTRYHGKEEISGKIREINQNRKYK